MKHISAKKWMAWTMSVALLITQFSAPVYAQTTTIIEGNPKDSGIVAPVVSSMTITEFGALTTKVTPRTVPIGTTLEQLDLPTTLTATGYTTVASINVVDSGAVNTPAEISIEGVSWEIDHQNAINDSNSTYDPTQGSYCFTPILPEGYTVAEGVQLPEIWLMVGGVNLLTAAKDYGDFSVTTESGSAPTYNSDTLTLGNGTYTIAMKTDVTSTTTDRIVVETGVEANITLNGVDIQHNDGGDRAVGTCAFELKGTAKVNLTLMGTNVLKSGANKGCQRILPLPLMAQVA